MRLENPLILPITGNLTRAKGFKHLVHVCTLKVQSLILKNAETVSYLSLLFENKFQDILIFKYDKVYFKNMLCVFKKTLW